MGRIERAVHGIIKRPVRAISLVIILIIGMTGTLFGRYLESVISGYQSYIHQQVGFCINLMGKTEGDSIPDNLAEKIGALDVVLGYNAESSLDVTPSDFQNYIPSELLEREGEWEGDKSQVRMWGAVNTQYSTYFFQRQAELLEGRYPKKGSNEVVIEQEFAAYNHLSITDRIHIMRNKDESELALQVVGIYKINQQVSESIMISDVNGFYQNTSSSYIFCDYEMLEQISGTKMPKITYSFYAKDEKGAEKLEEYIKGLELDSYEYSNVSKEAEGNFSNFLVMLQQNSRNLLNIANISIYCILFLMILLWMRDHCQEAGIYIVLGRNRFAIIMDYMIELATISGVAFLSSFVLFELFLNGYEDIFLKLLMDVNVQEMQYQPMDLLFINYEITWEMLVRTFADILLLLIVAAMFSSITILVYRPRNLFEIKN